MRQTDEGQETQIKRPKADRMNRSGVRSGGVDKQRHRRSYK